VISAAENSNKFPKTRLWKEKSVEDMVTLVTTAQATLFEFFFVPFKFPICSLGSQCVPQGWPN
jgi:hypothetical protein